MWVNHRNQWELCSIWYFGATMLQPDIIRGFIPMYLASLRLILLKKKLHASHPHVSNYLTWMVVAIYLSSMLLMMLASAPISSDADLLPNLLSFKSNVSLNSTFIESSFSLLGFPFFVCFVFVPF